MSIRFINAQLPGEGNETEAGELHVESGRFTSIDPPGLAANRGDWEIVDLEGRLVLPGVIDAHVHFNDPGFTHRENFETGTRAAAAGGVTCVADMPCTSIPPVTNPDNFKIKLSSVSPKAYVDYMFWGGISGEMMAGQTWRNDLKGLAKQGVAAIKIYMLSSMETFSELNRNQIRKVLKEASRLGLPVGVHGEDPEIIIKRTEEIQKRGGNDPAAYALSRPVASEVKAVGNMIALCRETGTRVHIVHLSSGAALDLIASAKREGLPISAETCPHFLEFTRKDLEEQGALLKTAPVVKEEEDRIKLWDGIRNGDLDFVTTDHAAGKWPEEKNTGSIWTDYGGVPGVELLLPYLYSEGVNRGCVTLGRLVEITSEAPAKFLGIDDRKGSLAPGYDADFVVMDRRESWVVHGEGLHNLNRYTPLQGRLLTGRITMVYLRGACIYKRDDKGREFFGSKGTGRFVGRK